MAISLVNTAHGTNQSGSSVSPVATGAFVATAGNLIVAIVRQDDDLNGPTSVSDTAGNSYSNVVTATMSSGDLIGLWYAKNITGNAANVVSATWAAGHSFNAVLTLQYSGCDTTSPLDAHAFGTTISASTIVSGSFTTTAANEVIVVGGSNNSLSNTYSGGAIGSGTGTFEVADGAAGAEMIGATDLIVSAIQTGITAAMGFTAGTIGEIVVATFKSATQPSPIDEDFWNVMRVNPSETIINVF